MAADGFFDLPPGNFQIEAVDYDAANFGKKALLRYRGIWTVGTLYNVSDVVRYAGNGSMQMLYAVRTHTAGQTWRSEDWGLLVDFSALAEGTDLEQILEANEAAAESAADAEAAAASAAAAAAATAGSVATAAGSATSAGTSATNAAAAAAAALASQNEAEEVFEALENLAVQAALFSDYIYTATSNQTVFSGLDDYNRNLLLAPSSIVYGFDNGVLIPPNTVSYNSTEDEITLSVPRTAGHIITFLVGIAQDALRPVGTNIRMLQDLQPQFNGVDYTFELKYDDNNTLFVPGQAGDLIITVGGILLEPTTEYDVENYTISFAAPPRATDKFSGRHMVANNVPAEIGGSLLRPESFGAVGDQIADDSNALALAFNEPVVYIENNYRLTRRITRLVAPGTSFKIYGPGSIYCDNSQAGLTVYADPTYNVSVTSVAVVSEALGGDTTTRCTKIGLGSTPPEDCKVGSFAKLIATDQMAGLETGCKVGITGVIVKVLGNDVWLNEAIGDDTYSTGMKLVGFDDTAAFQAEDFTLRDNVAAGIGANWEKTQLSVRQFVSPKIDKVKHRDFLGVGLSIEGCVNEQVDKVSVINGFQRLASPPYIRGYGIQASGGSTGGNYTNLFAAYVRHGFTTDAAVTTEANPWMYGRNRGFQLANCVGIGCTGPWDTHQDAVDFNFGNLIALGGVINESGNSGIQLRGLRGKASDLYVSGHRNGISITSNVDGLAGRFEVDGIYYRGSGQALICRPSSVAQMQLIARRVSYVGTGVVAVSLENCIARLELDVLFTGTAGDLRMIDIYGTLGPVKLILHPSSVDWSGQSSVSTNHRLITYQGDNHKLRAFKLVVLGAKTWDTPLYTATATAEELTAAIDVEYELAPTRTPAQAGSAGRLAGPIEAVLHDIYDPFG